MRDLLERKKMNGKKPFIITIDTEGDNLWAKPTVIETQNAEGLYRFQELCNSFRFKPVYLTNYEMAISDSFVRFGRKYLEDGQCEIGMHLHAWNSPPSFDLTGDDYKNQPYLYEYPKEVIDSKVGFMTNLLRSTFGCEIVSHRAGRWAMSEEYFTILAEHGYKVDCSVTPGINWSGTLGNPAGKGGADYSNAPHDVYRISCGKEYSILEVPVTISRIPRFEKLDFPCWMQDKLTPLVRRFFYRNVWLRPMGDNLESMIALVNTAPDYLQFMIHSSELSVGLNPTFLTEESIDTLYMDLQMLFELISRDYCGMTLKDFHDLKRV